MNSRKTFLVSILLALVSAAMAACGSSDSGGSASTEGAAANQCAPSGTIGTTGDCPAADQCAASECSDEKGAFAGTEGVCGPYNSCLAGCGCTSECEARCQSSMTADCTNASKEYELCVSTNCESEAASCGNGAGGAGGSGDGGAGGGSSTDSCGALSMCCSKLDTKEQQSCNGIVMSKSDYVCATTLQELRGEKACD